MMSNSSQQLKISCYLDPKVQTKASQRKELEVIGSHASRNRSIDSIQVLKITFLLSAFVVFNGSDISLHLFLMHSQTE
jgi:hypothetical protein